VFWATEDVHSDVWLKYYRRIAEYMQMPCDTAEDHEALWDAVAGLESFHNKLSMPKLGRWFAWNGCAHMQMKEFHATKMLFEHHLEDSADPDEVETFDTESFEAAAKAKTPQAELAALKASSGGLRLAYKLMSSIASASHQDLVCCDATMLDMVRRSGGQSQNAISGAQLLCANG
jgi:hypothetical protein